MMPRMTFFGWAEGRHTRRGGMVLCDSGFPENPLPVRDLLEIQMPQSPAMKRKIALYDLNDAERALLRELADEANRSLSRWVADAVRAQMQVAVEARKKGKK